MNFKQTAIALAVTSAISMPISAAEENGFYAIAQIGLESMSYRGENDNKLTDTNLVSYDSVIGVAGETELTDNLTAFGRFEWNVDMSNDATRNPVKTSTTTSASNSETEAASESLTMFHRYVGVKGDFGSLTMGQTFHSYYNLVYSPTYTPWWGSDYAYLSPNPNISGRTDNGVTYAGETNSIKYSLTGYFERDGAGGSDGSEVAVSIPLGDMALGAGIRTLPDDADNTETTNFDESKNVTGVSLSGMKLGVFTIGVGYQSQDEMDAYVVSAYTDDIYRGDTYLGDFYIHLESATDASNGAATRDPFLTTLGYSYYFNDDTLIWAEVQSYDNGVDSNSIYDEDTIRVALRHKLY